MPFVPLNNNYSSSRQMATYLRRSIVTGTIGSDGVDANEFDSAETIALIDSNYVQLRQTEVYDNKTYSYTGTLAVNTGTRRLYMTRAGTFGTFDMFVKTAPVGADLTVQINKNGSSIGTGTISDGATTGASQTLSSTSFASGDYITVDITQIGSSTAGEDLYINFRIAG